MNFCALLNAAYGKAERHVKLISTSHFTHFECIYDLVTVSALDLGQKAEKQWWRQYVKARTWAPIEHQRWYRKNPVIPRLIQNEIGA